MKNPSNTRMSQAYQSGCRSWKQSNKARIAWDFSTLLRIKCRGEWRHMISVTIKTTTKRLIIHEAESTHKYHHKYPLEIHSTRKKNWNKRLRKHLGNLKKTLVKLQVISRWPRARQSRGPVRMLLINKGVSPLVRIPAVTWLPKM